MVGKFAMKSSNSLRAFAKELRNNSTDAERHLWRYLRNSQLEGAKFRRQQPIDRKNVRICNLCVDELYEAIHEDEMV